MSPALTRCMLPIGGEIYQASGHLGDVAFCIAPTTGFTWSVCLARGELVLECLKKVS
jgi:hypothetical protein